LVVGKHAGRHGIAQALAESGLKPNAEELDEIVQRVHSAVSKGKRVMSADLFAIAETVLQNTPQAKRAIVLEQLVGTTGNKGAPTASGRASVHGVSRQEAHVGVGPVDAAFRAVHRMLGEDLRMEIADYHVDAITGGSQATVQVSVTVEDAEGRRCGAQSANVDIVIASVDALLTAINHLLRRVNSVTPEMKGDPNNAYAA
jgi:2-isopropylmalate synthase